MYPVYLFYIVTASFVEKCLTPLKYPYFTLIVLRNFGSAVWNFGPKVWSNGWLLIVRSYPPVSLLLPTPFHNKFVTGRRPVRRRQVGHGLRWFGNCPVDKEKRTVCGGWSVGKDKRIRYVEESVGKWTIGNLPSFKCGGCLTGEGYLGRGYFGDRHLVCACNRIGGSPKLRVVSPEEILLLPVRIQDFCLLQIFAGGTFTNPFIIEAWRRYCILGMC